VPADETTSFMVFGLKSLLNAGVIGLLDKNELQGQFSIYPCKGTIST